MTITPALVPDDIHFNQLANRLSAKLSASFGHTLREAEDHIRAFFVEDEKSIPEMHASLKAMGVELKPDYSAIVLYLGYRLAGGNPEDTQFLDWRKDCRDALEHGERLPIPEHLTKPARQKHDALMVAETST